MRMDSKTLEQLLEKYWKCETSLEEEKALREYFNGTDVPDALKETAALFRFFESERTRVTGEEVVKHVTKEIRRSQKGKVISMVSVARIAAGLLVVVAATYFVRQEVRKSYPPEMQDTITDPKLALEETKKALMMISKGFGKAREEAGKMNLFNEAEQKISGKDKEEEGKEKEKINI
jgi:hypothetical protein